MREITQREFRNESGKIMREIDGGRSFIVTRNGVPVAELTPLHRRRFLETEKALAVFRIAPPIDGARFREDLEAIADQTPEPRA